MGLVLRRNLGASYNLDVGEFCLDAGETIIRCPLCGDTIVLDEDVYKVAGDGKVTPMWRCEKCPCIEWITLEVAP